MCLGSSKTDSSLFPRPLRLREAALVVTLGLSARNRWVEQVLCIRLLARRRAVRRFFSLVFLAFL